MRLFYFLIPLCFIQQSFALDCVSGAPGAGQIQINTGGVWNCDNLIINTPLDLTGIGGALLEINVALDTQITANIILNGAPGINGNTAPLPAAIGGPGAGDGGGVDIVSNPEPGTDGVLANGKAAPTDATCPNGGGGGGMFTAGTAGSACLITTTAVGAAGASANGIEFDFGGMFRGGYGGGSGGLNTGDVGPGGGGGGSLHIIANGNVTISSGVTIFSRGGNGGAAIADGGGGGGGSGGAIWIQSTGVISNSATIDLRGGSGGSAITAALGGNGGDGVFRFQDSNTTTTGSGLTLPSTPVVSTPSLKSDITCGTIAEANDDQNLTMQMMMGFVLALMLGLITKKKKS